MPGILDRERTIAPPGFNRWLVPPAALCVHLCIGMAYGFSVFWKPLGQALQDAEGKPLAASRSNKTVTRMKSIIPPSRSRLSIWKRSTK